MKEVTDKDFELEVLKSNIPVVVDFWAKFCGPCMGLATLLEQLEDENKGMFKVVKVNVQDQNQLANRFGVMSLPTLMIFANGAVAGKHVGSGSKSQILKKINSFIGG